MAGNGKTWGDFVNTKVDVTYEKRKSRRKHVNKLLMPKGSITMGYASAALKAYQEKIHKFQSESSDELPHTGDSIFADDAFAGYGGRDIPSIHETRSFARTAASKRAWNGSPARSVGRARE
eukprot:g4677.t1